MGNRDIEAARLYHEATKHSYTSVRSSPHFLDWDNRPIPYKIYPDAPALALPRDLSLSQMPTLAAISTATAEDAKVSLDIEKLTRILFCANGLTRSRRLGGENYHFRAAPSAGALYPVEIYLACGEIGRLAPGLYHFSPADLKLRGLRPGDVRAAIASAAANRPSLRNAQAVFVLSTIFWRSAWKYRARAYRYCFWDAGTMLANMLAAMRAESFSPEVVTAFVDAEVEALIGADREHEGIACLVGLGRATGFADRAAPVGAIEFESVPLSAGEVTYPGLVKIHQESCLTSSEEVMSIATPATGSVGAQARAQKPTPVDPGRGTEALGLGETVLRRGSTRVFSREPILVGDLEEILVRSSGPPPADFPPLCDIYLIVNSVAGMDPGAYLYDRTRNSFELIRGGDFRAEAGYLCLEQPLGADCSALVCYMADLENVLVRLGNRGYREAHLEAGILGGRAYFGAYALSYGATGLTFYDDDTTKFFRPKAEGKSPILMVALGVPRNKERR